MAKSNRSTSSAIRKALKLRAKKPHPPPSKHDLNRWSTPESKAGGRKRLPATSFVRNEIKRVGFADDLNLVKGPPKWFLALLDRKLNDTELIAAIVRRVERAPTRSNLLAVHAIANEIGKRKGGSKLLNEVVTQSFINKVLKKRN